MGDVLRSTDSPFSNYKIYQEYPVWRINNKHLNTRHRFDWVILDLHLIIECHGQQHEQEVRFGGISLEEAEDRLSKQKLHDNLKMDAAVEAGFTYIIVPYQDYDKVDSDYLWSLYKKCYNGNQIAKNKAPTTKDTELKKKAKEYRQKRYQIQKEYYNKLKKEAAK